MAVVDVVRISRVAFALCSRASSRLSASKIIFRFSIFSVVSEARRGFLFAFFSFSNGL
jgi:hypothetical protein